MARKRNLIETHKLTISTTSLVVEYLGDLTRSGLWGKNAPETVERLVTDQLRRLIHDGDLKKRNNQK